ncbi:MAG: class I SAM-dependent methyltransferase [Acidobacteriia bacterium]|nr:class I SAM-dependent methyltransferase [Terriglobia bacterium]
MEPTRTATNIETGNAPAEGSDYERHWMNALRAVTPEFIRRLRQKRRYARSQRACNGLTVEKTFELIYRTNLWGGRSGEFYSGHGSDAEFARPYCEMLRQFIRERHIQSVVDIGCGDFRVGRNIVTPGLSYLGLDVVPPLVERNQQQFGSERVQFQVFNAIESIPPAADLCLIRQVLQHLSNEQVLAVLGNCRSYPHLIISEHLILDGRVPFNVDKPHGADLRCSGLVFDLAPFNLKTETLLEVPLTENETIRTVLIRY